jgi:hypothetical protein
LKKSFCVYSILNSLWLHSIQKNKTINAAVKNLKELFVQEFQQEPLIVKSPKWVNIIAEHTDDNIGFVLLLLLIRRHT